MHTMLEQIKKYLERKGIEYTITQLQYYDRAILDDVLVVLADWENPEIEKLSEFLEDQLVTESKLIPGYDGSYFICRCGHACEIAAGNYIVSHGECTCRECIENNQNLIRFVLDEFSDNPRRALPTWAKNLLIQNEKITLVKGNLASGFLPGQKDNPELIVKKLLMKNPYDKFIVAIDGQTAFTTQFSIWKVINY